MELKVIFLAGYDACHVLGIVLRCFEFPGGFFRKAKQIYAGSRNSRDVQFLGLDEKRNLLEILRNYLKTVSTSIQAEFEESSEILRAFSMFDPYKFPKKSDGAAALADYGNGDLEVILSAYDVVISEALADETRSDWLHFKKTYQIICRNFFANLETKIHESSAFLDPKYTNFGLEEEDFGEESEPEPEPIVNQSKKIVHAYHILQEIQKNPMYLETMPRCLKLLQIYVCLPVTTCSNERAFSMMKHIKNRLRNRLSQNSLNSLMKIGIQGPRILSQEDTIGILKEFSKSGAQKIGHFAF